MIFQVADLENELRLVADFQIRQKEIDEETITLRESNRKLEEQINRQKYELERDFVDQTGRLKRDFDDQLQEQRKAAEQNIHVRMHDVVKQIVDQNKQLSHELKLHIEVSQVLSMQHKQFAQQDTIGINGR